MRATLHDRVPNAYYGHWLAKMPANTRQNGGPLPVRNSLRAPESRPSTLKSEISQGIARRRVGNLSVDQKEKSARPANDARPATTTPLTASI
jgi:hypothetical protein